MGTCRVLLGGKAVRILAVVFVGFSLRAVQSTRAGCTYPLGMSDGRIRNTQLSAESSDLGWGPGKARLNGASAWCSDSEKLWTTFLQIRLDKVRHVSGISSQGQSQLVRSYYVLTYALRYSLDGIDWHWYKDVGSDQIKIFTGNSNYNTEKRNTLRDTFVTLYLRVYPLSFYNDMCLRLEIYGCLDEKESCTKIESQTDGDILSPNYPRPYPPETDCTWIITLPDKAKQVAVIFKDFDVQEAHASGECTADQVEVLDGPLDTSTSIGRYCNGKSLSPAMTTGNTARIQFHSGFDSKPRKGFLASFLSFTQGVDPVKTTSGCHGSSVTLDCSVTKHSIQILHVHYGAYPYSSACGGGAISNKTCQGRDAVTEVMSRCQYHHSCVVDVSGHAFNVSCGEVKPRLEVYYQCNGKELRTTASPTTITTVPPTTATTRTPPSPPIPSTPLPRSGPPATVPSTVPPTDLVVSEVVTYPYTATPSMQTHSEFQARGGGEGGDAPLIIGLGVAITFVAVVTVIVVAVFLCRRRRRQYKGSSVPDVIFSPEELPKNGFPSGSSRKNDYETVNILYESADSCPQSGKHPAAGVEYSPLYDRPEPLPGIIENPLYECSGPSHGYESVGPTTSPSSSSPVYDSPLTVIKNPAASITNPNYDKNAIDIPLA